MSPARTSPPPLQDNRSYGRRNRPRTFVTISVGEGEDERVHSIRTNGDQQGRRGIHCLRLESEYPPDFQKEGCQEHAHGEWNLYIWEQQEAAGTGNGEDPITRERSGQEGSGKGYTEGHTSGPWATLLVVSTGTMRRDEGEIVDSGREGSYLRIRKDEPRIPLTENKEFLTISAWWQGNGKHEALAQASFAYNKQRHT